MSEYASSRFGWDAPARIATSTTMLQEAAQLLPGEPMYDLIPFYPSSAPAVPTTKDGYPLWQQTPTRVDLVFWQGDDVVIPLYFNDPNLPDDDMSALTWRAEIRVCHYYDSARVAGFAVAAEFQTGTDETDEYTKVEMFLPRQYNNHAGIFRWEIYAISDSDLSRFPKPEDVADEDWPPPDTLHTLLYGNCTIIPRVAPTDWLPPPIEEGTAGVIGNGGFFVGPNGRVP